MTPDLEAKLSLLLDGELAPEEAAALRREIAERPELEAKLAELAAVDEGLRALPSRPVPGDLRARLAQQLRAEAGALRAQSGRHTPRRRAPRSGAIPARRWLAAGALAAAAAALALVLLPQLQRPDPGESASALAEDLPVIEVLDVLAELDELEEVGSG